MFRLSLVIIGLLAVHSAHGRILRPNTDMFRTLEAADQGTPANDTSAQVGNGNRTAENTEVDTAAAASDSSKVGTAASTTEMQSLPEAAWNSTSSDAEQGSKVDFIESTENGSNKTSTKQADTASANDITFTVKAESTIPVDGGEVSVKDANQKIQKLSEDLQTAWNQTKATTVQGKIEELTQIFQQNTTTSISCSKQCSPLWLSALEMSVGQLPPTHPICLAGNYTSCIQAESVCTMEPTKIVCCPMECLGPITTCYKGQAAENMCIPIDVTQYPYGFGW